MKILIVCQYYYPENFTINKIAEKLFDFGNDVTVLTGKPNYGYGKILSNYKKISSETINGVKVERVNIYPRKKSRISVIKNYLSFWKNSKKWVKKTQQNFDIVYSMSLSPVTILSAGNKYKKMHNVPHVVHCVDLWPESTVVTKAVKKKSLIYKILYRWSKSLYSKADEIILGSKSFETYFNEVLELKEIEKTFVPQPSLIEETDVVPFSFDNNYTNILYCGNLGLIQNIDILIESMNLIKDKKVRLNIIGMGPMSEYVNNKIREYKLEDTVINFGPMPISKAASYVKASDFLYVGLKNEGYVGKTIPNKLIMYMAFGKPIVSMLEGDGKEILVECDGAIHADQSKESLAKAFICASNYTPIERQKLGNNNLTYFKSHFTNEIISKEIENILFRKIK